MLKIIKVKPIWKNAEATNKNRQSYKRTWGCITDLGPYFIDEETETQRRKVSYDHSHNFKRMAKAEVEQGTQHPKLEPKGECSFFPKDTQEWEEIPAGNSLGGQ